MARARGRDRPRVRTRSHRHHRGARRGGAGRMARRPLRAPPGHPRRVPRAQAGGPRVRASPAGRGSQRSAAVHGRRGAPDHGSGNDALHGPPQRRLRGPAPAPVALLRPHGRVAGATRGPGRRLGRVDVHGDQAAGHGRHDAAHRPGPAGRHRWPGVRALLRGRLPAPAPGGGVGPHGRAPARRGGVRPPLRRAVHARLDAAPGQGGNGS